MASSFPALDRARAAFARRQEHQGLHTSADPFEDRSERSARRLERELETRLQVALKRQLAVAIDSVVGSNSDGEATKKGNRQQSLQVPLPGTTPRTRVAFGRGLATSVTGRKQRRRRREFAQRQIQAQSESKDGDKRQIVRALSSALDRKLRSATHHSAQQSTEKPPAAEVTVMSTTAPEDYTIESDELDQRSEKVSTTCPPLQNTERGVRTAIEVDESQEEIWPNRHLAFVGLAAVVREEVEDAVRQGKKILTTGE